MQKELQDSIIISEDPNEIKSASKQRYGMAFFAIFFILLSLLIPFYIYLSYFHRMNISLTLYIIISIAYEVFIIYYLLAKNKLANYIRHILQRIPIQTELSANGIKYSFGNNSKNLEWRELEEIERILYVDETDSDQKYQIVLHLPDEQLIEVKDNERWENYNNILRWSKTLKRSEIRRLTQEDIQKELDAVS